MVFVLNRLDITDKCVDDFPVEKKIKKIFLDNSYLHSRGEFKFMRIRSFRGDIIKLINEYTIFLGGGVKAFNESKEEVNFIVDRVMKKEKWVEADYSARRSTTPIEKNIYLFVMNVP